LVVGFIFIWVSAATAMQSPGGSTSASVVEHPVPVQANTPAATCLECHGSLAKGKYVHSAMEAGCTTCHSIQTRDGVTRIALVAPPEKLCESCHALSTDKVLHGPYRDGLCVTCHSPHGTDFPNHTWASAQDICLGCHARQRLKEDAKAKTVTTPWGKTLSLAEMKGWTYLNLNNTLTANHPVEGHPVSGPNRKPNLPPLGCESCHQVHASNYKNLLTAGPPKDMPLCATCGVCQQCHENLF
jgi:predicted CXXCH cytochrome family protein